MMEEGPEVGDAKLTHAQNPVFDEVFVRNCRNRYLQQGFAQVAGQISTLRTHRSVPIGGAQERSYIHHRQIEEAFRKGDILAIDGILTEHILSRAWSYIEAMQNGIIKAPDCPETSVSRL